MSDWDFWDWCLVGVGAFTAAAVLLVAVAYSVPRASLVVPELETSVQVATLDDFPPGTARLKRWGSDLILVIRGEHGDVTAVSALSPADGCVLRWDPKVGEVVSPCSYAVFSRRGGVLAGLTDRPLRTYPILIRDGVVSIGRPR